MATQRLLTMSKLDKNRQERKTIRKSSITMMINTINKRTANKKIQNTMARAIDGYAGR